MLVSKQRLTKGTRNFNIDMCLIIFAELGFKYGPLFSGYIHPFYTVVQDGGFAKLKSTSLFDRSWTQTVSTIKIEGPTSKLSSSKLGTCQG